MPFALMRSSPRVVPTQMFESRSRRMLKTWTCPRNDGNSIRRKSVAVSAIQACVGADPQLIHRSAADN
jgi:hypothetical protein